MTNEEYPPREYQAHLIEEARKAYEAAWQELEDELKEMEG